MPKPPRYARIAITLPKTDLAAADRLARSKDRSRSWIIAEAVRRFAMEPAPVFEESRQPAGAFAEMGAAGLGPSRLSQLKRDLALTPEERVREAEETLRLTPAETPGAHRVMTFDRYEDFLAFQRARDRTR